MFSKQIARGFVYESVRSCRIRCQKHRSSCVWARRTSAGWTCSTIRGCQMTPIQLYTYQTPNGHKASIMLEETGVPYEVRVIDIEAGEQQRPNFLALNSN